MSLKPVTTITVIKALKRNAAAATDNSVSVCPPALKKFKLMSNKVAAERQLIQTRNSNTAKNQLEHYIGDIRMLSVENAYDYWMERRNSYNRLVSLALDLLAAPASQVYIVRVFLLCGYLTGGRRNRMEKSLEMRAFLKMNGLLSVAVAVGVGNNNDNTM